MPSGLIEAVDEAPLPPLITPQGVLNISNVPPSSPLSSAPQTDPALPTSPLTSLPEVIRTLSLEETEEETPRARKRSRRQASGLHDSSLRLRLRERTAVRRYYRTSSDVEDDEGLSTDDSSASIRQNIGDTESSEVTSNDDLVDEPDEDREDEEEDEASMELLPQQKLEEFGTLLRRMQWSFRKLLFAWLGAARESSSTQISYRRYRTVQLRRKALRRTIRDLQDQDLWPIDIENRLRKEFEALHTYQYFNRLGTLENFDSIDFEQAVKTIKDVAPIWDSIITPIMSNRRAHRSSYASSTVAEKTRRRIYAVTSMICYSRATKRSNFLQHTIGTYLISSGTKRRVIETLNGLGISQGYHTVNYQMNVAQQQAAR